MPKIGHLCFPIAFFGHFQYTLTDQERIPHSPSGGDFHGKVAISGQDADLAAVQRIVEGTQSMTVYKPIKSIATKSAEVAVQLAKGEKIQADETVNNGKVDVPFIKLDPIMVDKDNVIDTVIKDGFHSYDEVYKNVPEDKRPPRP
ncbi:D-xylose-binding periplasmic protein [Geobacillus stearothermophilus]|nr:D-xylose-binding periplasmic protein [Geobacillus stearothermophilus]